MNVDMEILLKGFQSVVQGSDGSTGVGRGIEVTGQFADFRQRVTGARVFAFHGGDGICDGAERYGWHRLIPRFGPSVLHNEGKQNDFLFVKVRLQFTAQAAEHRQKSRQPLGVARAVDGNDLFDARFEYRQVEFQIRMMRFDNMAYQFIERKVCQSRSTAAVTAAASISRRICSGASPFERQASSIACLPPQQ